VGDDILCTLYFADSQIIIAKIKHCLSYVVRKLQEACEQRGIIINKRKYEYTIFANNKQRIYL
jgi:hypothetical protein